MKTKTLSLLLVVVFMTPWTAIAEESLESVLSGYYEAIGGLESWQQVRSLRITGRLIVAEDMETEVSMVYLRPLRYRMEATAGDMTRVQAFDGETAWAVVPFAGSDAPQVMPEEFLPLMREQADFAGPLIGWQEKGHQVEYLGAAERDGEAIHHLTVRLENGGLRHYFLSAETFLPASVEAAMEFMGDTINVRTVFGDYREVGDLVLAHSVTTGPKGAPEGQWLEIDAIELNVQIDESIFDFPETDSDPVAADESTAESRP